MKTYHSPWTRTAFHSSWITVPRELSQTSGRYLSGDYLPRKSASVPPIRSSRRRVIEGPFAWSFETTRVLAIPRISQARFTTPNQTSTFSAYRSSATILAATTRSRTRTMTAPGSSPVRTNLTSHGTMANTSAVLSTAIVGYPSYFSMKVHRTSQPSALGSANTLLVMSNSLFLLSLQRNLSQSRRHRPSEHSIPDECQTPRESLTLTIKTTPTEGTNHNLFPTRWTKTNQ